jgi:hypothetical protein
MVFREGFADKLQARERTDSLALGEVGAGRSLVSSIEGEGF